MLPNLSGAILFVCKNLKLGLIHNVSVVQKPKIRYIQYVYTDDELLTIILISELVGRVPV